ncbi:hypothetical protein Droror1_Dr00018805 [Drosera rotundifolia]
MGLCGPRSIKSLRGTEELNKETPALCDFEAPSCRVGKLDCRGVRSLEIALGVVASHCAADSFSCCSCVAVCGEEPGVDPSSKAGLNEVIVGFVDNLRGLGFDVLSRFLGRGSSLGLAKLLGRSCSRLAAFNRALKPQTLSTLIKESI